MVERFVDTLNRGTKKIKGKERVLEIITDIEQGNYYRRSTPNKNAAEV